jgi:AcrR family transcriptional regulator
MPLQPAVSASPARRRAGTRGMPRAQREQLILDVAGVVFARDGYHGAAMEEIAQLADVSKPMLYAYFGSKQGLYLAYIHRSGGELVARLRQASAGSPAALVRAQVDAFLGFVAENSDGWRVLWREAGASRPVADEVASLRARLAGTVRELIESGAGGAPLAPGAADAAAHAIVGAGESLANWWLAHPDVGREQLADWYTALVVAAVRATCAS